MARRTLVPAILMVVLVAACGAQDVAPTPAASTAVVGPTGSAGSEGSPSATPSSGPAASASPTASPTPSPAPWQAYRSKRYHYRISYPPTWVVTPGSAKFVDTFDGFDYPYVYISRDAISGTVSVSRTVSSDKAYYRSHYKAKVVSNKAIKLAGWSGRIVTYSGSDSGFKLVIQRIVIAKGRVAYFVTMHGDAATLAADKALFGTMYRTFRRT